jgi:hypothetical protein
MENLLGGKGIWAVRAGRYSFPNATKGKEFSLVVGMRVLCPRTLGVGSASGARKKTLQ